MLAAVKECHLSATTQHQAFSLAGLSLLPQEQHRNGKHDLVSLDSFSVEHNGPLTALRRSGSSVSSQHPSLQKITLELGAAAVCLDSSLVVETRSLLARFKKNKTKSSSAPSSTEATGVVDRTSSASSSGLLTGEGLARASSSASNSSGGGGLLKLRRKSFESTSSSLELKLHALPREIVLQMTSLHVSGTSEEGLYGAIALEGGVATCQCHVSTNSTTATSASNSLVTGTATWQKLNCSIAPDVSAPPGVELQCSSSEIGLTASPDSISSGNGNASSSSDVAAALAVNGRVKINAMHTRIKHWDLHELAGQLSKLLKMKKKEGTSSTTPLPTHPKPAAAPAAAAVAISSYKLAMSLGEGSSLQFLDGDSECMWLSSLHSADLAIDRAFSSDALLASTTAGDASSAPTLSKSTPGLGISFQATEIAMTTAQVGPHLNVPVDNLNKFALEKVLAAKLVRILYSTSSVPSPPEIPSSSSSSYTPSPSPFAVDNNSNSNTATTANDRGGICEITTEDVHAVLHPASVGALADVSRAIAALKTKKQPPDPSQHSGTTTSATTSSYGLKGKGGGGVKKPLPKLTFNFTNTLFIAPATVTIPAAHSSIGRIQLVHSTLGASLATATGSIHLGTTTSNGTTGAGTGGKGSATTTNSSSSPSTSASASHTGELALRDFSVVYSESLAAQKFPEDAKNFQSYVKSTVLGLRNGTFVQERIIPSHLGGSEEELHGLYSSSNSSSGGRSGGASSSLPCLYKRRLKLDQLTFVADADAMGCAIQAADDILAMYQLLKASTRQNNSWSRLRSTTTPSSQQEEIVPLEAEVSSDGADGVGSSSKRGSLTGLGTSGSELDAVDIITLNEMSRAALRAGGGDGGGVDGDEERKTKLSSSSSKQKIPVYVDITAVKVSLPLSADIEVSLEVDAMHAELAPARGVHLVRTEAMNLTMKGKTVLKWTELAASLHTNSGSSGSGAATLPLQPLHPMRRSKPGDPPTGSVATGFTRRSSMAASLSREMSMATDWSIHTSPGNSPRAGGSGSGDGSGAGHRRQPQWPASGATNSTNSNTNNSVLEENRHGVPPSVEDTLPTGLLPYHRAGLSPWLPTQQQQGVGSNENAPSSSSKNSTSFPGKDEDNEEQKAEYLGSGPRSSLDLHVCGFEFTVPYDREPGPTQRYAEMYFKAVSAAFTHSVKVLRKKSQQTTSGGVKSKPEASSSHASSVKAVVASTLFPLQLNLRVDGFVFRFEHHPMEKWLAVHGPLLRQAALQEYLWEKAVGEVQNVADVAASPLHAGIVESAMAPSSAAIAAAAAVAAAAGGVSASGVGGGSSSAGPSSLHNEELLTTTSVGATAGATTTATGTHVAASEAGSSHSGGGSGVGSGSGLGSGLGGDPGKEHAWEGLVRTLAAQYKAEATKAAAAAAAARKPGASAHSTSSSSVANSTLPCDDLLVISADVIQILVVVCDTKTTAGHDAALRHITRLDPASAAVELMGARKLHIDLVAHSFAFHLASASQPFISASRLVLSGPIAIAKQRTAPPTTTSRTLAVGAHRAVDIQTNVRGCKAPFKLYTDVSIEARRFSVVFTPGYEPALAMMGMAGKRLAPSDPDKTAPRPPPVPWWDDLRYLWRGKARLHATPLRVVLAAHQLPTVDDTSEKMLVRATAAEFLIGSSGDHSVNFQNLSCSFYQDAGVDAPGGALIVLPFIHAPVAKLKVKLGWKLPNGRLPQDHHLFPPTVLSSSSGVQAPVVLAQEYKAEGLDVALDVYFGQGAVSSSNNDSSSSSAAAAASQLITALTTASGTQIASGTALGFLGDKQIAFLRDFSRNMRSTPAHIKACAKRGTFFARKPRGGPPKKGIPKLLQLFKLSISASPLEIVHFTADPNDPSAGLRIGASSASFGAAWLLNQPMPSFLQLPPHLRKDSGGGGGSPTKRTSSASGAPPATRSITQDFFLSLGDISMHRDDPKDDFFLPGSPGSGKLASGSGAGSGSHTTTTAAATTSGDPLTSGSAFASDPYSLGHKGGTAAGSTMSRGNSHQDLEDAELEEGARHAAALLQSLVERRGEATATDNSVLSATTLTVSRRPKPNGDDDGGGDGGDGSGGGGDGDDPNLDPVSAAFGTRKPRPLRVVVSNCRFLMDLGTRNAVWGAVSHMIAAFAAKPKTGRGAGLGGVGNGSHLGAGGAYSPYPGGFRGGGGVNTPGTAAGGRLLSPLGSLLSPAAITARHRDSAVEVQRRISNNTPTANTGTAVTGIVNPSLVRASSSTSEIGATPETNELLSLLLQQREAAGGDTGSGLPTPQASTGDEISSQDGGGGGGGSHYGTAGGYGGTGHGDGTEDDEDAVPEGDTPMTTPLDDVHSLLRYEVEVNDLQVMMLTSTEAGPGPGRLLLAAKSGRLRGLTLQDGPAPLQITTLGLEDVQAYVSITDIDPHVSLSWLHVDKSGFSAPEDGGPAALRRVFNPICIDMRHSKAPSSSLTTRRAGSVAGGVMRQMSLRSPTPGGGYGASMMKTDELILKVREYEGLK